MHCCREKVLYPSSIKKYIWMCEDIPAYSSNSDSDSDVDSGSELSVKRSIATNLKVKEIVEEYDEEDCGHETDKTNEWYSPAPNLNFFSIPKDNTEVVICLRKNQQLLLCGQFNLQIIKGGITYNNIHYNSSWRNWEYWHPACNAISPIVSSHYAGWEKRLFLSEKFRHFEEMFASFDCVVRVSNGLNLQELTKSIPEIREIWGPLNSSPLPGFNKHSLTFTVLPFTHLPQLLTISQEWATIIDELRIFHSNSSKDMRIMTIGGKNSGKSTFMRLLLQKFLHSDTTLSDEAIHYLDMDPGQPEYSAPESISWNKVNAKALSLGQHLCQGKYTTVKQHFLGSSSPQDWPTTYSDAVEHLLKEWQDENFMGTSFLNLPGWIKGFGIRIINHAMKHFKPTHIIFLSHNGKPFSTEIKIPEIFSTTQRVNYKALKIELHSPQSDVGFSHSLQKFNAAMMRQFKLICYFHKTFDRKYFPKPILSKTPLRVSFGDNGIIGFRFLQESNGSIHGDDVKLSLDGTVVALHLIKGDIELQKKGLFPFLKSKSKYDMSFITLALIHSINLEFQYMNIYVPQSQMDLIRKNRNEKWILVRGKTETPLNEIIPDKHFFKEDVLEIPYVSFNKKKRHEHVWKVRKNVMRRGHFMK